MKNIIDIRLQSHHLTGPLFSTPEEVVKYYGCMQAQDIQQAMRCIWSRTSNTTQEMIKQACRDKSIVRTWPMRGTLHYMAPEYVHWMLDVCAAKTLSWFTSRREFLGMSWAHAERALILIKSTLKGGKVMTRKEITEMLIKKWIPMQTQWTYHLLCYAATSKVICFGPPNEKEDTFVLLDEWVPNKNNLTIDEWYAELARMYIRSHGPCTVDDLARRCWLAKWACKKAIGLVEHEFENFEYENKKYFYLPQMKISGWKKWDIRLLWWFDEYFLSYKNRAIVADIEHHSKLFTKNGIFPPLVMIGGKVIWTRKRKIKKDTIYIDLIIVDKKVQIDQDKIKEQAQKYANFVWIGNTVVTVGRLP